MFGRATIRLGIGPHSSCLLSRNCQRRSVVQVDGATVESGNRYSVTELAQHQQRTTVMPTPCDVIFYAAGRVGPAGVFRPMHISN